MLNINDQPTDAAYDACSSSILTSELSSNIEVIDNEDFDTSKFKRKLETIS